MGDRKKVDPRIARMRRDSALARAELRGPTEPRVASQGATSMAIKVQDPLGVRDQVEAILAVRRAEQQAKAESDQ